ncbi:MAG: N-acetylglucosamine-6-phosphate deacetylase [Coriobacteriales bacterium]|nr:N-acetylglucosamine-6-phosphate deacetylase [Coriobacteriales bacterium]
MNRIQAQRGQAICSVVGGLVFDGHGFMPADIQIDNGHFTEIPLPYPDGDPLNASGCYVIPGLIDLHFHGCKGEDFSDGSATGLHTIAAYEAYEGITAICPASMTLSHEHLIKAFANAAAFKPLENEAALVGINMEGPYISPQKLGAQNPAYVRPASVSEFEELQNAAQGLVKLVDVAPEIPGTLEFVSQISKGEGRCADGEPARVSLAHTCAGYDCAREAFAHGANHMTHLFNAMPGLHHRDPGPIAAAAENPAVMAELICDGVHVHEAMVKLAFKLFGSNRIILISDTMRACGLNDGTYDLGGQEVHVKGSQATLKDGTLAGSVTNLMHCLQTAIHMGVPVADAMNAATINPARALHIDSERGSIEPGKIADAVILDADYHVQHVIARGCLVR